MAPTKSVIPAVDGWFTTDGSPTLLGQPMPLLRHLRLPP